MNAFDHHTCPSTDVLAKFIDARLSVDERASVVAHVSRCGECRLVVYGVLDMEDEVAEIVTTATPIGGRRSRWLAAVAAITVAATVLFYVVRSRFDHLEHLAASMPTEGRSIEPRLTGGFRWAPLTEVRRGGGAKNTPTDLVTIGAAGVALREIGEPRTAESQHAAAVAHLLAGDRVRAIDLLKNVIRANPGDAQALSDLSAALYCNAVEQHDAAQLRLALEAADRALRIDADTREASFNRALILERIGSEQTKQAWTNYLSRDPSSPWAAEAREHLRALSPPLRSPPF